MAELSETVRGRGGYARDRVIGKLEAGAPEGGLPLLGGRVALRENRARQHRRAGPRGSEAARPKINLLEFNWSSWARRRSVAACARRAPRGEHVGERSSRSDR